jgi:hypothetical protein
MLYNNIKSTDLIYFFLYMFKKLQLFNSKLLITRLLHFIFIFLSNILNKSNFYILINVL